jgi:formamidopyrimidine-DNA glycosylase
MPELPEVETIKSEIELSVLKNIILKIEVSNDLFLKNTDKQLFIKKLNKQKFIQVNRIGKLIYFKIDENTFLLSHLGMTGKIIITNDEEIIKNKHSHVTIKFKNFYLVFNDQRRFGYLKIVNKKELVNILSKYGIEPLSPNFTLENFKKLFKGKRILKSLLLDQSKISGIGNIYADEICFNSNILQNRTVNSLSQNEIEKLFSSTQKIIKSAIENKGTTFSDYRNTENKKGNFQNLLQIFNRNNQECNICKNIIKKIKVAGRGTYYCEKCQK